MKRLTLIFLLFGLVFLIYIPSAMANGAYFSQIPEGLKKDCTLCHSSVPSLNDFGQKFKSNNFSFTGLTGEPKKDPTTKEHTPVAGTGQTQGKPGGPTQPPDKQDAQGGGSLPSQVVKIELILPGGATRGEKTQLQAKVTSGDNPLAGKEVNFFAETDFFGQSKVNLGKASTDAGGVAKLNYWPQAATEKVSVVASIDKDTQAAGSLALTAAGPLYHKGEGLEIPFLGTWAIGLVVGAIWATYFYAGYTVLGIKKLGRIKEQGVIQETVERSQARA